MDIRAPAHSYEDLSELGSDRRTHVSSLYQQCLDPLTKNKSFGNSSQYSLPAQSIPSIGPSTPFSSTSYETQFSGMKPAGTVPKEEYYALRARYNESQRENLSLMKRTSTLEAKYDALWSAYNLLLSHVPQAAPPKAKLKLSPEDFPDINFWYRQQWTGVGTDRITDIPEEPINATEEVEMGDADETHERSLSPAPGTGRGKTRSAAGINVSMQYIELKNGTVIDGHRATNMRQFARCLWVQLAVDGKLFASWGEVDAGSKMFYYREMADRFEELAYCELDWKAEMIASDNYSGWKQTWLKKRAAEENGTIDNPAQKKTRTRLRQASLRPPLLVPEAVAAPSVALSFSRQPSPMPNINITPGTPAKPMQPSESFQDYLQSPSLNSQLLQPVPPTLRNFSIDNPLTVDNNQTPPFPPFNLAAINTVHQVPAPLTPALPVLARSGVAAAAPIPPPPLPAGAGSKSKGGAILRPGKTTTSRNLCAKNWKLSHPKGTSGAFEAYWLSLSDDERRHWEELSKQVTGAAGT